MQYSSFNIGLQVGLQQAVATQQSPTQVVSNVAVFKAANTLQYPTQVALHIHYVFQENMCTILYNAGLSLCTFYNTVYATINQQYSHAVVTALFSKHSYKLKGKNAAIPCYIIHSSNSQRRKFFMQ